MSTNQIIGIDPRTMSRADLVQTIRGLHADVSIVIMAQEGKLPFNMLGELTQYQSTDCELLFTIVLELQDVLKDMPRVRLSVDDGDEITQTTLDEFLAHNMDQGESMLEPEEVRALNTLKIGEQTRVTGSMHFVTVTRIAN